MNGEEVESAIQFLIEHHAKVSTDIEGLKESQQVTAAIVSSLAHSVSRLETQAEVHRREVRKMFAHRTGDIRDGFNKLILSNEVTRDLASQVAQLAIPTS